MTTLWLIVALILVVVEIATLAFFAVFLALGALAAALAALLGFPLIGQAFAFGLASVLGLFLIRPPLQRLIERRQGPFVPSGAPALIGQRGKTIDDIPGGVDHGHVRVGGEDWPALSATEAPIQSGRIVIVVGLRQTMLVVEPDPSSVVPERIDVREEGSVPPQLDLPSQAGET